MRLYPLLIVCEVLCLKAAERIRADPLASCSHICVLINLVDCKKEGLHYGQDKDIPYNPSFVLCSCCPPWSCTRCMAQDLSAQGLLSVLEVESYPQMRTVFFL